MRDLFRDYSKLLEFLMERYKLEFVLCNVERVEGDRLYELASPNGKERLKEVELDFIENYSDEFDCVISIKKVSVEEFIDMYKHTYIEDKKHGLKYVLKCDDYELCERLSKKVGIIPNTIYDSLQIPIQVLTLNNVLCDEFKGVLTCVTCYIADARNSCLFIEGKEVHEVFSSYHPKAMKIIVGHLVKDRKELQRIYCTDNIFKIMNIMIITADEYKTYSVEDCNEAFNELTRLIGE